MRAAEVAASVALLVYAAAAGSALGIGVLAVLDVEVWAEGGWVVVLLAGIAAATAVAAPLAGGARR